MQPPGARNHPGERSNGRKAQGATHAPRKQRTRREEKAGRGSKNCFHKRKALRGRLKTPLCARAQGTPSFAGPSHKLGPLALRVATAPSPTPLGFRYATARRNSCGTAGERKRGGEQAEAPGQHPKSGTENGPQIDRTSSARQGEGKSLLSAKCRIEGERKLVNRPDLASHQRRQAAFLTAYSARSVSLKGIANREGIEPRFCTAQK